MSATSPPAMPDTRVAASAVDARKVYGSGDTKVQALDGVTVDFESGRFTAIMGTSGSGKSTLMHTVARSEERRGGQACGITCVLRVRADLDKKKIKQKTNK